MVAIDPLEPREPLVMHPHRVVRTFKKLTAQSGRSAALIIVSLFTVALLAESAAAELVQVGAAKVDITPAYPVRLAGYGNRRAESEGVAQRLWAKAIAIGADEGEGPAVWIVFENCGLTTPIRERVASTLLQKAGVKSERIAISVTHTHTAPCLTGWAPYIFGTDLPPGHQENIDRYTTELTGKLSDVALAALANRRPAKLS